MKPCEFFYIVNKRKKHLSIATFGAELHDIMISKPKNYSLTSRTIATSHESMKKSSLLHPPDKNHKLLDLEEKKKQYTRDKTHPGHSFTPLSDALHKMTSTTLRSSVTNLSAHSRVKSPELLLSDTLNNKHIRNFSVGKLEPPKQSKLKPGTQQQPSRKTNLPLTDRRHYSVQGLKPKDMMESYLMGRIEKHYLGNDLVETGISTVGDEMYLPKGQFNIFPMLPLTTKAKNWRRGQMEPLLIPKFGEI